MNGAPSFGQAQRGVNRNEIGPRQPDNLQYLVVAVPNVSVGSQATKETQAGGPAWRTGEIDADNDRLGSA
jgi:hypothetical protein